MLTVEQIHQWWDDHRDAYADKTNPPAEAAKNCVYTDANGCHCLIGQMLTDLGYDIPAYGDPNNTARASRVVPPGTSPHLRTSLNDAQRIVDRGEKWGFAMRRLL